MKLKSIKYRVWFSCGGFSWIRGWKALSVFAKLKLVLFVTFSIFQKKKCLFCLFVSFFLFCFCFENKKGRHFFKEKRKTLFFFFFFFEIIGDKSSRVPQKSCSPINIYINIRLSKHSGEYDLLKILTWCKKGQRLGGGVVSEKVSTQMYGPDRVPFRLLRFTNGPFLI